MKYEVNIDSSIIISILKSDIHCNEVIKIFSNFENSEYNVYLSLISYSEIWTGIELLNNTEIKNKTISFLNQILHSAKIKIVSDNIVIAQKAARTQAEYKSKGGKREVLIPDFLIGANALFYSGKILTTNPRDFLKYFPDLEVITPKLFLQKINK